MSVPIEDYSVKQPVLIADRFRILVISLVLGESASIRVDFLKQDRVIFTDMLNISGEEYANWGTDDTYLENLVIMKYGIVKKEEPIAVDTDTSVVLGETTII